jgi:hypothetical protein
VPADAEMKKIFMTVLYSETKCVKRSRYLQQKTAQNSAWALSDNPAALAIYVLS